jgi:hypothetical protein
MKQLLLILLAFISLNSALHAQSFTAVADTTYAADTLNSEIIFEITVTNTSASELTLYIKRTVNDIPADWTSSLCFNFCFSPTLDSIATSSNFGARPLSAGESRQLSLHVFPRTNTGTGNVTLRFGDAFNFADSLIIAFTASANPVGVDEEETNVTQFKLNQNYPNPFNPTTTIRYSIPSVIAKSGATHQSDNLLVQLKVFDVLGRKVATLVNRHEATGGHAVKFQAGILPSGIYFYTLSCGGFTSTKKMILMK